jgi:hypothetical protein
MRFQYAVKAFAVLLSWVKQNGYIRYMRHAVFVPWHHWHRDISPKRLTRVTFRKYRRADNSRSVSFTVNAWEWVCATNLSRLQRETRETEISKRHVGEARSVLVTAILLPQRLSCYWGKTVSLRMLTNLRLATCVWPLRKRDPPAKICRPPYRLHSHRRENNKLNKVIYFLYVACSSYSGLRRWKQPIPSKRLWAITLDGVTSENYFSE